MAIERCRNAIIEHIAGKQIHNSELPKTEGKQSGVTITIANIEPELIATDVNPMNSEYSSFSK